MPKTVVMSETVNMFQTQTFYARCVNRKCRVNTWDDDDVMDWVDCKGRMRFYIDEEDEDSYSGVHDVHPLIYINTYDYYNMHRICCSLCNENAAFKAYSQDPIKTNPITETRTSDMTHSMTIELLKNDLTLKRLRHNLKWMEHLSATLPQASSAAKCSTEVVILKEMIDSRTQCISNCLPSTCDCVEKRILELTNDGKLDRQWRTIGENEGPIRCCNAVANQAPPEKCLTMIPVGGRTQAFREDCSGWTDEERLTGIETTDRDGNLLPNGPQQIELQPECFPCAVEEMASDIDWHMTNFFASRDHILDALTGFDKRD
tara:strand:- start:1169 stop:2119 length:951 start_codon:yes stop_codon:yes gene_type:complete